MLEKSFRKRIEAIKRQKIASRKVVNIRDYRLLKYHQSTKHILVVNDDPTILSAVKRVLEIKGFAVFVATDGVELSRMLESISIDLFILDINLPWVDGYDLCSMIKSDGKYNHIPVVLMSARGSDQDIEKGYLSGCDDFLIKPFDLNRILQAVEESLPA